MPSWAVWKSPWVGLCLLNFSVTPVPWWGITSLWALVLWKHHALALTSLSALSQVHGVCLSLEKVAVQGWLSHEVPAAPWYHLLSVSSCHQGRIWLNFSGVPGGSVKGLFWAGVTWHRSTDLTQTWKVFWLRGLRGFVWRQGDKPSSWEGNCFLEGAVVN